MKWSVRVAYSCELGAADYTRPIGFLTNVPGLIREVASRMAGLPTSRTCFTLPRSSASVVCLRFQTYFPRGSSNVQGTTALPARVLAVLVVASICKV